MSTNNKLPCEHYLLTSFVPPRKRRLPAAYLFLLLANLVLLQRGGNNSHDATRRRLAHCPEAYSSKCLEVEFSEVRLEGVLGKGSAYLDYNHRTCLKTA